MKNIFQPHKFLALSVLLSTVLLFAYTVSVNPIADKAMVEKIIAEMKGRDKASNTSIYPHLSDLYEKNSYQLVWKNTGPQQGLKAIQNSRIHGLNPEDYGYTKLSQRISKANPRAKISAEEALRTDIMLSYAHLLFGKHMVEGKTNPESFYNTWNYQRRAFEPSTVDYFLESVNGGKLNEYISYVEPDTEYYTTLKSWMSKYYAGELDDSPELQFSSLPLKKGMKSEDIVELKYRLSQYGAYSTDDPSDEFDEELEVAVKEFQKYMGIEQDGVVGKGTLASLNITLDDKRDIMLVNMERARWLLHDLPSKFLLVNIAGYELYIFENLKMVHDTPVIVGKPHHETPIFHADMKYIELNCTWTVPYSISSKELLPAIKKNPNYLESRHFEVLQNGQVIDPSGIDWSKYSASNFPYTLRQKPGSFNSLGTMKFIFPNSYAIYLHDTPARYLFDKEGTRAFSHGCVRVKNPTDLAVSILGPQGVTKNDIRDILDSEQTQRIFLDDPLPVFLTYWTVFPDFPIKQGTPMHWVKDIYERDERLLKALNM